MSKEKEQALEVPDLEADHINPQLFKITFQKYGSILVRNLLDKNKLNEIRRIAEVAYNNADNLARSGHDLGDSFRDQGHINAVCLGEEDGVPKIIKMFANSQIPYLYKELLGQNIKVLTGNSLPRRQHPGKHNPPVPFHQDASFMGNPGLIINSWIPLNEAGLKAPGIQVVLRPESLVYNQSIFETKHPTTYNEIDISQSSALSGITSEQLWAPIIAPGDVLFFSHLTIHRTYQTDTMSLPRISLEIRCMG